ncbi:MAG: hypothetical protein ACM3S2_04100 [Ignavibacteriales bacterium]
MGIKDKLVSKGAEKFINIMLEGIGSLSGLSIDSKNKAIQLIVALRGETEPVKVTIKEYEITNKNNTNYIIIHRLDASREWMNAAFEKYMKDRKFEIPSQYDFIIRQTL